MITLGDDIKDCDDCTDPTKKRTGTAYDINGPGSVCPVWDCENESCKRKQNTHAIYLYRKQQGGGGHE